MILQRLISDVFAENCYLLASSENRQAVVVDPGSGIAPHVAEALENHGLELAAVLLTHGHPDHVWDAAEVAGDKPVYIAEPDAYRLDDPLVHQSPLTPVLRQVLPFPYRRPENVQLLPPHLLEGGGAELVPGIPLRALPAPGHSEGSTIFFLGGEWDASTVEMAGAEPGTRSLVLTGDVLFRGSIGRTDLPGGDPEVMTWTLRTLRQVIAPDSMIFPGHGEATTMRHELATNPFLR
ncbi:MAG: MBL fold metallo-hydrolase [bacterium]|nr:MBL fold metallo-hydrolase [bacterium]